MCGAVQAQVAEWVHQFGGESSSAYSGNSGEQLVYDPNSARLFIAGSLGGDTAHLDTVSVLSDSTYRRMFVGCYDTNGNALWAKSAYSTEISLCDNMELGADGNLIVSGYAKGIFVFDGDTLSHNAQQEFFYFMKMDQSGNVIWMKHSTYSNGYVQDVSIDESNNIYFIRSYKFDWYYQDSLMQTTSSGGYALVKLDPDGNLLWSKHGIGGSYYPNWLRPYCALTDDDQNNLYLYVSHLSISSFDTITVGTSNDKGLLVRMDSNGTIDWRKFVEFSSSSGFDVHQMGVYQNSLYLLGGHQNGYSLAIDSASDTSNQNGYKIALAELNRNTGLASAVRLGDGAGYTIRFHALEINEVGEMFFGGNYRVQHDIGGVNINGSFSFYSGVVFMYDIGLDTFRWAMSGIPNANECELLDISASANGAVYFSGHVEESVTFTGGTTISGDIGHWTGYLGKLNDCRFEDLTLTTIGGANLCSSDSTVLTTGLPSNYDFTWYRNALVMNGVSDSALLLTQDGNYYVIADHLGCRDTSQIVQITDQVGVNASLSLSSTSFCEDAAADTLSGGQPGGGTYFGSGVSNPLFDPSVPGPGLSTIYYTVSDSNGCSDTAQQSVLISSPPLVFFNSTLDTVCVGNSYTLNSGLPTGGSYSGASVSGNTFIPTISDTGEVILYYTYTNGQGCSAIDSSSIVVQPAPTVSLNLPIDSICSSVTLASLSGGIPSGGQYSGTGVSGSFLVVGILPKGMHEVFYQVNVNGCAAQAVDSVYIDSAPQAIFHFSDPVCASGQAFTLYGGTPSGGDYFGTGVSSNQFDPSAAGSGTYSIGYAASNNCGVDTTYANITVSDSIAPSITPQDVTCFGSANGSVAVIAGGGIAPYSYQWSNGDSTNTITGLSPGTYQLTVTDSIGCSGVTSAPVNEPTALQVSIDSVNDASCNTANDGEAHVSATGGIGTYSYSWSNGATGAQTSSLTAGTYTVTVSDSNACTTQAQIIVGQSPPIILSDSVIHNSCSGSSSGAIYLSPTGGNGGFTYAWSSGQTTASITNSVSGTYHVTVTDASGCTVADSATITEPDSIALSSSVTNESCFGAGDGSITVTAGGGTGTLNFLWSSGATTQTITGLTSSSYTVTVTDSLGCTHSNTSTVQAATPLNLNVVQVQSIACHGDSTAVLTVNVSGGTAPYTYAWSTGAFSDSIAGLPGGTYSVTVTDSNGCASNDSMEINAPAPLHWSTTSNNISCHGNADGVVQVSTTGGSGPASLLWNTGFNGTYADTLTAGVYSMTATDSLGCATDTTITLTEPDSLQGDIVIYQALHCAYDSNGTLGAQVTGGNGAYTFSWNTGSTGDSISDLMEGDYSFTVTDSLGCTDISSIAFDPLSTLQGATTTLNVNCFGDSSGIVGLTAVGAAGVITYQWSNGATTANLNNAAAGAYTWIISDSLGCMDSGAAFVYEPAPLTLSGTSIQHIACADSANGSVTLAPTGGTTPYHIQWPNGDSTETSTHLGAGFHTVTITDSAGCTLNDTFEVSAPDSAITMVKTVASPLCFGDTNGSISAFISGGVGDYTLLWSTGATDTAIHNLAGGIYGLTVTDSLGCSKVFTDTLTNPALIGITVLDSVGVLCSGGDSSAYISLSALGGTSPHSFTWSTGDSTALIQNLDSGTYTVTLTDSNGCTASDSFYFDAPTPLTAITASLDLSCYESGDGFASLDVSGGTPFVPTLAVTEVGLLIPDFLEITNVSEDTINTDGWTVLTSDAIIYTSGYNATVWNLSGDWAPGEVQYRDDVTTSSNYYGQNLNWSSGWPGWIMILDSSGTIMDFVSWEWEMDSLSAISSTYNGWPLNITDQWIGSTLYEYCGVNGDPHSFQRIGYNDFNSDEDWVCDTSSLGVLNDHLNLPFGPNYNFQWSTDFNHNADSALAAGQYFVSVYDANGCMRVDSFQLAQPDSLQTNVLLIEPTCFNDTNGQMVSSPTGGTSPYMYNWSNGGTDSNNIHLGSGVYFLTVTDAQSCERHDSIFLGAPDSILVVLDSVRHNLCHGDTNGYLQVSVTGGVSSFDFDWSNGDSTAATGNLTAGVYALTVGDSAGCALIDTYTIDAPSEILINLDVLELASCDNSEDATVEASVSGGVPPYTYYWNGSATSGSPINNAALAGINVLQVTDSNACIEAETTTVGFDATAPLVQIVGDSLSTNGDPVSLLATSNEALPFLWSTGATSDSISVGTTGLYWVSQTNGVGCTGTDSLWVTIYPLGVNTPHQANTYTVFPNPTTGKFTLQSSTRIRASFDILNAQGQVIQRGNLFGAREIDLSAQSAGIYLVHIHQGKSHTTLRLLMQ